MLTWTKADGAMPRWTCDQDPGLVIEQLGLGAWVLYTEGARNHPQGGYRAEVEAQAEQAFLERKGAVP